MLNVQQSNPEDKLPRPDRIAVRLNDLSTPHFKADIEQAVRPVTDLIWALLM